MTEDTAKTRIIFVGVERHKSLYGQGLKAPHTEFMCYVQLPQSESYEQVSGQGLRLMITANVTKLDGTKLFDGKNPILVVSAAKALISAPTREHQIQIASRIQNIEFQMSLPYLKFEKGINPEEFYVRADAVEQYVGASHKLNIPGTHDYARGIIATRGYDFDGIPIPASF